jgi:hypothetical protein
MDKRALAGVGPGVTDTERRRVERESSSLVVVAGMLAFGKDGDID